MDIRPTPFTPMPIPEAKQEEIFLYISQGMSEDDAVLQAGVAPLDTGYYLFNENYNKRREEAIKKRADYWATKVMKQADEIVSKDEAAGAKLQFEKLKWLAEIDNPDKYGPKSKHTVDVTQNVTISVKNMPIDEARKILNEDPFSVPLEADYREIEEALYIETPKKEYSL